MTVKAGVIGVGYLGQHHARIYAELDNVEFVAVADCDIAKAEAIAGKYGCRAFAKHTDMLALCDAVSIVTPTTTHHAIAMDCLNAGKDVLVEKPISDNLDEANEIAGIAELKGRILQVGHLERYNQGVIAATAMVRDPRFIESERLSPFLGRATDVDVTFDLMIHDIDIVLSIVKSEIKDIRAFGESVLTGKIDVAKVWLEFENGCKALITASRLASEKQRKLRVFQQDSYISIDYQTQEVRRYFKAGPEISFDVIKPEQKEPLKEDLKDFICCVMNRTKPKVSGHEAIKALEIVLAITSLLRKTPGA